MSRIRITGGTHRSRVIQVADVSGLRPTPDRVRETLFNWLGQDLSGLTCLDLFAGSGILGFEAASRGAAQVTLVEKDGRALTALRKHAEELDLHQVRIVACSASDFSAPAQFDVIFLDPPYGKNWLDKIAPLLHTWAKPDARIYAEAEHPLESLGNWQVMKRGHAGQVYFHLLEHATT